MFLGQTRPDMPESVRAALTRVSFPLTPRNELDHALRTLGGYLAHLTPQVGNEPVLIAGCDFDFDFVAERVIEAYQTRGNKAAWYCAWPESLVDRQGSLLACISKEFIQRTAVEPKHAIIAVSVLTESAIAEALLTRVRDQIAKETPHVIAGIVSDEALATLEDYGVVVEALAILPPVVHHKQNPYRDFPTRMRPRNRPFGHLPKRVEALIHGSGRFSP